MLRALKLSAPCSLTTSAPRLLARLPHAEGRALGVGEDGHPARLHDVERLGKDGTAGRDDCWHDGVNVVGPDVGVPQSRWSGAPSGMDPMAPTLPPLIRAM